MDYLKSFFNKEVLEVGCDEVGRGALSGPVCAAAVIFSSDYRNKYIKDSKQLTAKKRIALREKIQKDALYYAVAEVNNKMVDKINVLESSFLAIHKAIEQLSIEPLHIIVDGNRFKPYRNISYTTIIKGDQKYLSIAAASILAKTYRDDLMIQLHKKYPQYDWKNNKGYPTKKHKLAIQSFGITKYHRRTFNFKPTVTFSN